MEKEIIHDEAMKEFLQSLSNKDWKAMGESAYIESEDGLDIIEYIDFGDDNDGASLELNLWKDGELKFQFCQEVSNAEILSYVVVPPFCEENWSVIDDMHGVVYGPDGYMLERVKETGGQPKKIDMEKTVGLFLRQVAERRFDLPVLVEVK